MQKDDGLAFTHIDVADLGVEHLDPTPRQMIRTIRFCRGDDRVSSRRANRSNACGRETS